jgi:hypothetical protein
MLSCPHGNHVAETRPDEELRAACKVCGGPRIALAAEDVQLKGKEQAPLVRANKARAKRFFWRTATAFGAAGGGIGFAFGGVLSILFGAGLFTAALPAAFSLGMLALVGIGLFQNRSLSKQIKSQIDLAWKHAARDVIEQNEGAIGAAQLAEKLGLSAEGAEGLLSELAVDNFLDSDISGNGELTFAPAMRIDTSGSTLDAADAELEARFEALAAAEAEAARVAEVKR